MQSIESISGSPISSSSFNSHSMSTIKDIHGHKQEQNIEQNIGHEQSPSPSISTPFSLNHSPDLDDQTLSEEPKTLPSRKPRRFFRRIHGWSWQAWPIAMGTGAVFVLMSNLYNPPEWVVYPELFFFFFVCALFLLNVTLLVSQAILFPSQSLRLVRDPVKGVFVPLIVLSFATIVIGISQYGVKDFGVVTPEALVVLFWIYLAMANLVCIPMLLVWFNCEHSATITSFTPAYMFLVFPLMLTGVVGFNCLSDIDKGSNDALIILLVSYVFQGLGTLITFMYLAIFCLRIITTGFMEGHQANGAFVAAGPPGFTALALLKLGEEAREIFPQVTTFTPLAGEIFYNVGILAATMLLGCAWFFFLMAAIPWPFKVHYHSTEVLGMWALTFPLVGMISTFKVLGDIFECRFLHVVHAIFTVAILLVWCALMAATITAFCRGKIFKSPTEDVLSDTKTTFAPIATKKREHKKSRHAAKRFDVAPHIV
ncbi:hypothetical protein E3P96_02463 [Wallemia ichthyophaga]|uniref:Malic acid transport protein n=1 Tax=Wallemia ichthyophaga TaxID=245174 RepID=A0A4T0GGZ5_WALIC|nr:hypothetical protein E3P96_02463 [Wallemia ichthyophaga]TIB43225.1 hypothetical protein E3P86_00035 [Wallemia ichthyophaga]